MSSRLTSRSRTTAKHMRSVLKKINFIIINNYDGI